MKKWGELKYKNVLQPVRFKHVNTKSQRRSMSSGQLAKEKWNKENLFPSEDHQSSIKMEIDADEPMIEQDVRLRTMIDLGYDDQEEVYESCLRGYELKKYLGRGQYGSVAQACLKDNCNYAVKLMRSERVNQNELNAIKELSERDIGAKFIDAWECSNDDIPESPYFESEPVTLIVTEKWDSELPLDVCLPERLLLKLCKEIKILHRLGYVHGDILEKNILIKTKGSNIIDATLSDFGFVNPVEWWKTTNKFGYPGNAIKTFYNYHFNSKLRDYYIENQITLEDVEDDPTYLDKALMWKLWKLCYGESRTC